MSQAPEILNLGIATNDVARNFPAVCYIIYHDYLLINVSYNDIEDCLKTLDRDEIPVKRGMTVFVLNDEFSLRVSKMRDDLIFSGGGKAVCVKPKDAPVNVILHWLEPLLSAHDYKASPAVDNTSKRKIAKIVSLNVLWLVAFTILIALGICLDRFKPKLEGLPDNEKYMVALAVGIFIFLIGVPVQIYALHKARKEEIMYHK